MIRINLLPFRAARKRENIKRQITVYALVVIFNLTVIGYYFLQLRGQVSDLQKERGDLKAELATFQKELKEIKEFHAKRLDELIELCCEAKNLYQLTCDYYRLHPECIDADSIDKLVDRNKAMAMEEILAHVEYLLEDNRIFKTAKVFKFPFRLA